MIYDQFIVFSSPFLTAPLKWYKYWQNILIYYTILRWPQIKMSVQNDWLWSTGRGEVNMCMPSYIYHDILKAIKNAADTNIVISCT